MKCTVVKSLNNIVENILVLIVKVVRLLFRTVFRLYDNFFMERTWITPKGRLM